MATKKKTEEVVAEVKEAEVAAKKTTTKKTTTKKTAAKKEEPTVEEAVAEVKEEPSVEPAVEAEVEVVGTKIAEVKEEPKEVEPKKEKVEAPQSFLIQVVGNAGVYSFKGPGFEFAKNKVFAKNSKLTVVEVKGNWGKVSEGNWILLGGSVDKI